MEYLTAEIIQMNETVVSWQKQIIGIKNLQCLDLSSFANISGVLQPLEVQGFAMMMSSSVRRMVSAYQLIGNVTVTQIVRTGLMSTTLVRL